jgi:hypothetical protein
LKIQTEMHKSRTLHFKSLWDKRDEKSYVTLVEWANGEGYDVHLYHCGDMKQFSLSCEEFDALIANYASFGLTTCDE